MEPMGHGSPAWMVYPSDKKQGSNPDGRKSRTLKRSSSTEEQGVSTSFKWLKVSQSSPELQNGNEKTLHLHDYNAFLIQSEEEVDHLLEQSRQETEGGAVFLITHPSDFNQQGFLKKIMIPEPGKVIDKDGAVYTEGAGYPGD